MKTNKNFKRLLIFAIAAFLMLGAFTLTTSAASCDYEVWLYDSFGDGWNGNIMDIYVDGSPVVSGATVATGAGPVVYPFTVDDGSSILMDWQYTGSWPSENYIDIYDSTGTLIEDDWYLYSQGDWTGTASCPSGGGSCDYEICVDDTFGDTWNGGTLDVYVNGVLVLGGLEGDDYTPGVWQCHTFTVNDGDTIDLDYTYGSWVYENVWELYDSEGNLVHSGSGGYSDTAYDSTHVATCPGGGPTIDVGVTAVNSPVALDDVGTIPVEVEVENFGDTNETAIPVHVQISRGTAGGVLVDEGFEGSFPPTDWQIVNYGSGPQWVQSMYGSHSYEPAGSGSYYADCWYTNGAGHDTGLFTPSFDCGSATTATLEFERNFQDFAGYGYFEVNAYSGGSYEENLLFTTSDDPYGGVHTVLSFDPSTYADPSDVTIEFYYNDDNYAGWGVGVDDVLIETPSSIIYDYDETVYVDLLAGESATVTLPDWTATQADFYNILACTELSGDVEEDNDCVEITDMPIGNLDMELTDIYVPQTLMGPVPFYPEVTVSNVGDLPAENVPIHAVIEGGLELKFSETFESLAFNKITDEKIGVFTERDSEVKNKMVTRLNWEEKPMMDISDWTILDIDGDGETWHQHSDANEGSYGMYNADDVALEYNNNAFDWLISPAIDVGAGGEITVDLKYDTESYWDYLFVGNSPDGSSFSGYIFDGNSGGWNDDVTVPLVPSYIAPDGTTYICFMFSSDGSVNWYEGAHVDDVKVYGGGTVYDETVYADFEVGDSFNVLFPECNLPDIGTYDIEVCTELADDENIANDCDDLTFTNNAPVYILETGWGYNTIQEGIDAALPGQTVVATDGTYVEDIVINKDITVTGENPPTNTAIINGIVEITGDGATFMNFLVHPLTVFTDHEAAVTVMANDVTVQDNIITGVRGEVSGPSFTIKGIHVYGGSTAYSGIDILNNVITDILNENVSSSGPAGVLLQEDFEGTCPPAGWNIYDDDGTGYTWECATSHYSGLDDGGATGTFMYMDEYIGGDADMYDNWRDILEVEIDCTDWSDLTLDFDGDFEAFAGNGDLWVEVYDGSTWHEVLYQDDDLDPGGAGTGFDQDPRLPLDISSYVDGVANAKIRWRYSDENYSTFYAYGALIDNVVVAGTDNSGGGGGLGFGGATGIMIQGNLDDIEVLNNEITDIHSAGWCYGLEITQTMIPPDYPAPTMVVAEGNYFTGIGDGTVYDVQMSGAPYFGHMVTIEDLADATQVELHNNIFDPDCHAPVYAIINKDTEGILDATQNWFGYPDGPSGDVTDAVDGTQADGMGCLINDFGPVHFAPWIGVNAEAEANTLVAETGEAVVFTGEDSWYNQYVPVDDGGGAGCEYEVCLMDSYGDGWDIGYGGPNWLDVYVDGVLVLDGIYLNDGYGPECYTFNAEDGQTIELDYTGVGSYISENSYELFDSEGNSVILVNCVDSSSDWTGTATCPEEEEEEEFPGMSEPIYHWNFDDGTYSNSYNPTHVFTSAGTYNVYLRVQGGNFYPYWSNMMFDWAYLTIEVYSPGAPLSANADGGNLGVYETVVGETVQLIGSASGGTPPYTYIWDLGTGQDIVTQNPEIEFPVAGTYTVSLTVTDSEYNTATDDAEIIVNSADELSVKLNSPAHAVPDSIVTFSSTVSGGEAPYTYTWNFGDGAGSDEANPQHVYDSEGRYTVTLTVSDANGDEVTKTALISVESAEGQELEIKQVKGGLLVSATIKAGDIPADWSISVDGNVFLGGEASGTIPAGAEQTVRLPFTFGLGKVDITVSANDVQEQYTALALGPLFLNLQ